MEVIISHHRSRPVTVTLSIEHAVFLDSGCIVRPGCHRQPHRQACSQDRSHRRDRHRHRVPSGRGPNRGDICRTSQNGRGLDIDHDLDVCRSSTRLLSIPAGRSEGGGPGRSLSSASASASASSSASSGPGRSSVIPGAIVHQLQQLPTDGVGCPQHSPCQPLGARSGLG